MATYIEYANSKATRNRKLSNKLVNAMSFLGGMGVTMKVVSGGQAGKGEKGGRVGSTRHDHGNAADADFYMNGRRLVWSKPQDRAVLAEIVTNAARNGVTGIGAGDNYMGDGRIHIGFGSAATWGGGKGVAAPAWLRQAYARGRVLSRTNAGQKSVLASSVPSSYTPQQAPQFKLPQRRPLSELLAANTPPPEPFRLPERKPLSELLATNAPQQKPFDLPERKPLAQLLAQQEQSQPDTMLQPTVDDTPIQQPFVLPERRPLSELLAETNNIEQNNIAPELEPQGWQI